jgi:ParB-like chromosome segregation protein Spo0J
MGKRVDMYQINPELITEDEGWNVRDDNDELRAHIRMLADSIKEVGVLEPLTGYLKEGMPVLTNGHCRLLAVKLARSEGAEIKLVPFRNEPRTANEADRTLSMLTRNSGKPLTGIEQAGVIKRLLAFGWSQTEISKKTGFTPPHIGNLLTLAGAPVEVQNMVSQGKVSATLATDTVKSQGPEKATETLKDAVVDAESKGKNRATKKNVETVEKSDGSEPAQGPRCVMQNDTQNDTQKKVNWNKVGPGLLACLEKVEKYDMIDDDDGRSMVADAIAKGKGEK